MCGDAAKESLLPEHGQSESTWPAAPDPKLLAQLCDAHCHPIDAPDLRVAKEGTAMTAVGQACCMSSFPGSFELTAELAEHLGPHKLTPAFGIHPWFCHALSVGSANKTQYYETLYPAEGGGRHPELTDSLLDALPSPTLLGDVLESLRERLARHPDAPVGEIGIDRSFRIPRLDQNPLQSSPSHSSTVGDNIRKLTSLRTPIWHQLAICEAQLDVAIELGRNVSLHAVQAQGELESLLKRLEQRWGERFTGARPSRRERRLQDSPRGIHLDVHSPLISVQTLTTLHKRYPNTLFFSFSTTICGRSPRLNELIAATPDDRLLVESDWNGPEGMDRAVWEVLGRVCSAKRWGVEDAVERLAGNWRAFTWRH